MDSQLNLQQLKNHLNKFGFIKLPRFFLEELPLIVQSFDDIMHKHLAINPHDGKLRSVFWQCVDSSEYLTSLLATEKLSCIVRALVGNDFIYTGSSGNYYAGNTGWHTDDVPQHRRIKVAVYLETLTAKNGALRVIPGSHKANEENAELLTMLNSSYTSFGMHGSEIPAVAIDIEPGDIIVFDQNLIHSSWEGGEVRRMFSINFHQNYTPSSHELLEKYVREMSRFMRPKTFGEAVMNSNNPEILRMTAPIRSLEHVFARSLQERIDSGLKPERDINPDMSGNKGEMQQRTPFVI